MSKFVSLLKNPRTIIKYLDHLGMLSFLNDTLYLKITYYGAFGSVLNLRNPKTFNEKLQWLKLYDRKSLYTDMVDKYKMRGYVEETIGKLYTIPLVGVWDDISEIPFEDLPSSFVLKTNHDSGGVVVCKNKESLDWVKAKKKLSQSLKRDYYKYSREWPYKNVERKVICEEFLDDEGKELCDYKVHCFNGVPRFILVCKDRNSESGLTEDFFTTSWEHMQVKRPSHPNAKTHIACPEELEQLLELSKMLSKNIPFLRCDFYIINHKIYCGELTFFPASGMHKFIPEKWDRVFGDWLSLPMGGIEK